jgi:hypothetical protein
LGVCDIKALSEHCDIFDIHLHPCDIPRNGLATNMPSLSGSGSGSGSGSVLCFPEVCHDLNRVLLWKSCYDMLSEEKVKKFMPLINAWKRMLMRHEEVFSKWYDDVSLVAKVSKAELIDGLLLKSKVVGLQEVLPSDKVFLQEKYKSNIIFRPDPSYPTTTIGALIFKD